MSALLNERFRADAEAFVKNLGRFDDSELDLRFDSELFSKNASVASNVPKNSKKKVERSVSTTKVSNLARRCRRPIIVDKSIEAALQPRNSVVNMSRRPPSHILYAFPHFDKCDSLLYFPSTFTRHMNTSDTTALSKLFHSHIDKNCNIGVPHSNKPSINIEYLLKSYEVMMDMQPDRIMCVHTTKVVENQIQASIHLKFTDSKRNFDSVVHTTRDPLSTHHLKSTNRRENLINKVSKLDLPDAVREQYLAWAESDADIVIYLHNRMVLTFDDVTKKIIDFQIQCKLTSMRPVDIQI